MEADTKTPVSDRPAPARLTSLKKLGRATAKVSSESFDSDSEPASPLATTQEASSTASSFENKHLVTSSSTSDINTYAHNSRPSSPLVRLAQQHSLPAAYKPTPYDTHISRLLGKRPVKVDPNEGRWTKLEAKRMKSLSNLLLRLQDPVTGLEMKDRKKMFKVYLNSFLGSDLLDWINQNCDFLGRDEALRFCATLHREGYVISVDLNDKFTPDGSFYIFQNPFFWPQEHWLPSDFDYTVYLLKRSMNGTSKYLLYEWEEDRLYRLQEVFYEQWDRIENTCDDHFAHIKNALNKNEARIFRLQEYTFWKVNRPVEGRVQENEKLGQANKSKFKSDQAYEDSLSAEALLERLERKLDYYNTSLSINRLKVSYAAKTLIQRCEIWRNLDPILDSHVGAQNPWLVEESSSLFGSSNSNHLWLPKKNPTTADTKLWTFSFTELMRDPIGVKHFYDFVQKEFSQENLEFYLKCQALDAISTREEFTKRAQTIYAEFIQIGASRELNINSTDRNAIIAQFEALEANPQERLSYYVFADALKHIFGLMAKDSYVRFCSSDVVAKAMAAATEREKEGPMNKKGTQKVSREMLTE